MTKRALSTTARPRTAADEAAWAAGDWPTSTFFLVGTGEVGLLHRLLQLPGVRLDLAEVLSTDSTVRD